MTHPVDIVVPIPARDEEEHIVSCLTSVLLAVDEAQRAGLVAHAQVAVAAHRCSDRTAALSRRILAQHPDVDAGVHEHLSVATVGEVRHTLIQHVTQSWPKNRRAAWVFSTDADSVVPADWISSVLAQAAVTGAAAVAGLVALRDWRAGPTARAEYDQIIARGLRPDGHDHVYAANFAVNLHAYRSVGGFPSVRVGEDAALLERLRLDGWLILPATTPVVHTSARMPGRARGGLGALLQHLEASPKSPSTPAVPGSIA